jgi:uncharacterized protein YjdB/sorbitol-specific phosphotransferase system component IIA
MRNLKKFIALTLTFIVTLAYMPYITLAADADNNDTYLVDLLDETTYDDTFGSITKSISVTPGKEITIGITNLAEFYEATGLEPAQYRYEWHEFDYTNDTPKNYYNSLHELSTLEDVNSAQMKITVDYHKAYVLYIYDDADCQYSPFVSIHFEIVAQNDWEIEFDVTGDENEDIEFDSIGGFCYVEPGKSYEVQAKTVADENTTVNLQYQWYLDDSETDKSISVDGATTNSLTIDNITNNKRYILIAQDQYGNQKDLMAAFLIASGLEIEEGYRNTVYANVGDTPTLQVHATAKEGVGINYQWYTTDKITGPEGEDMYFEQDAISGENKSSYTVPVVTEDVVYICEVQSQYGDKQEIEFKITTEEAPVTISVTSLTLDKTTLTLPMGELSVLTATVLPENATNKNVVWSSSDSNVVDVDTVGNVTPLSSGTATITAVSSDGSNKTAQCQVTVLNKGESQETTSTETPSTEKMTETSSTEKTTEMSSTEKTTETSSTEKTTETSSAEKTTETPSTETPTTEKTTTETSVVNNSTTGKTTTDKASAETQLPSVGSTETVSGSTYKVTKSTADTKEVTYTAPTNKKKTSIKVPDTINIDGQTYKVTAIADKAFKNNSKLKSVTIGKNITKIGKEAFSGCKKLSKITVKSTKLKTVGKNAIKGINKKATIKVPKTQLSKYKKLFKSKTGFKKSMKIKK